MKDPNIPGLIKNYTVLSLGTTKSYHYIWTWSLKGIDVPGSKKYTYFSRYNKTIITLHLNLEHERCPRFKDMHFILLNKPYRYIWTWNMKEPDGKQHDIPPRKARKHLTGDGVRFWPSKYFQPLGHKVEICCRRKPIKLLRQKPSLLSK